MASSRMDMVSIISSSPSRFSINTRASSSNNMCRRLIRQTFHSLSRHLTPLPRSSNRPHLNSQSIVLRVHRPHILVRM